MKGKKGYRFFPDHVLTELNIWIFLLFLITVISIIFPIEMAEKANPLVPPSHVKPEWYFYPMYKWIKMTPEAIGIGVPALAVIVFVLWPYIDRFLVRVTKSKIVPTVIGVAVMVFITILMVLESIK